MGVQMELERKKRRRWVFKAGAELKWTVMVR